MAGDGVRNRKSIVPKKLRKGESEAEAEETSSSEAAVVAEKKAVEGDWLQRNEGIVHWIVLAVAFFTRFYRLDKPPGVVFDETHFGRFTNQYSECHEGYAVRVNVPGY